MRRRYQYIRSTLIIFDAITVYFGFLLAYKFRRIDWFSAPLNREPMEASLYHQLAIICTGIVILIFFWQGLYRPNMNHLRLEFNRRFLRSILLSGALIFIPFYYLQHLGDTRNLITLLIIIVPILLLIQKSIIGALLSRHYDRPLRRIRLLILGHERNSSSLLRRTLSNWDPGYKLLGFLARDNDNKIKEIYTESVVLKGKAPVLGTYDSLETHLVNDQVEEVWLNDPSLSQEELVRVFDLCGKYRTQVSVVPSIGRLPAQAVDTVHVGGQVLLREKHIPKRPIYECSKRAFDFIISFCDLVILSPLILLICIIIRLDSKGSPIFTHLRIGKDGKPFKLFKFRTMFSGTDPYAITPRNRQDPRITRFGRYLRKTSLDELPQLLNVLLGTMSLVGPRPEMPFIVEKYNRFHRLRLAIKPGITGLWQISADRSIPIHRNMDYDLYYLDNRSLITDMVILWRTLWTAINGI